MPRLLICLPTWLLALLAGAGLLRPGPARGQADSLGGLERRFAGYAARTPVEKLFMHLDRPAYVSGETLWFKLYAVEGTTQRPLAASSVAYVEVLNAANVPVLQAKIALQNAAGQGSLTLPAALPSGRYTVRAYTSWMRNFGPDYYFHTSVVVVNTRQPLGDQAAPRAAAYDPQFFPEGGDLVRGLPSRVGFKLTDQAGRGVAATGTVLDAAGASVAHFSTLWAGMGSFDFTPAPGGGAYRAVIKLATNQTITCALPPVRAQGYVLRVVDDGPDRLSVVVQGQGPAAASETLYLLGHTGQRAVVAAEALLYQGRAVFSVPKQQLAAGVSHFTVFNRQRQPLAERLYFRPPAATLALRAQPTKSQYAAREKVTLRLGSGPVPANLSVAVYQLDSLAAAGGADITSYLVLAADLRGTIENPGRYFDTTNPEAAAAADNLMLTQGWRRFRWAAVLAGRPDSLPYPPERHGPIIRGRVVNRLTDEPTAGVPVFLASPRRRPQLYNAISQPNGGVQFELPDLYGPRLLLAQTNTQRDSLSRVELFSAFSAQHAAGSPQLLTLPESMAASLRRRHAQAEVRARFSDSLPTPYWLPKLDSTAFYGPPSERYYLDKFTRFKSLEEVLREYVPGVLVRIRKDGFHLLVPDYQNRTDMEDPLLLLDGVPVFNTNRLMAFDPLKIQRLDVLTNQYFLGPVVHQGIISFTTYQGDLGGFPVDSHALLEDYEGLQGQRDFYAPRYDTPAAARSRLPDFRNLLYWNPAVATRANAESEISFYTSDQAGRYRIVVQGLAATGLTGSADYTIEVTPSL